jgi:hypothetical protein
MVIHLVQQPAVENFGSVIELLDTITSDNPFTNQPAWHVSLFYP